MAFLGIIIYGKCALDFTFIGRGTPFPLAAPQKLVINNLYRYSRNPMYLGVILILLGEAVFFGSVLIFIYTLTIFILFHLFIIYYEEPNLKIKFQKEYEEYFNKTPRWIPNLKKFVRKNGKTLTIILFLILLLYYPFLEPFWLEVNSVEFIHQDIPKQFKETKIVFLTDIHHSIYFSQNRVKNIVNIINKLKPDLILLGGDYVYGSPKYIEPCFQELRNLKASLGIYGVLGNHDHNAGANLVYKHMARVGITPLDNQALWIVKDGERIKVGGVGDLYSGYQDIMPTINDTDKGDLVILLSHNPDYVDNLKTDKIDLVLSGHTHGGQVTLLGKWAPIIPVKNKSYRTGTIKTNLTTLLISNGVGVTFAPIRLFARPQIYVIKMSNP